jgi:hypothetical protein
MLQLMTNSILPSHVTLDELTSLIRYKARQARIKGIAKKS